MTRGARATQHGWMVAGVALGVLLVGCATPEPVLLQHPETHAIARCAAAYRSFIDGQGYRSQEECIADYQRRGYQLAPAAVTAK